MVNENPIGKGFTIITEDRENTRVKFNSLYYLVKKEHPFRGYPDLLKLQIKLSVSKSRHFRKGPLILFLLMGVLAIAYRIYVLFVYKGTTGKISPY